MRFAIALVMKQFGVLRSIAAVALALVSLPARAEPDTSPNTQIQLVADASEPGSVGLAVALVPKNGWHLYWKNYGDAGTQTSISFTGWPKGTLIADWAYPTPARLPFGALMNYGYEHPITLLSTATLPPGTPAPARVTARLDWLACTTEVCVPETKTLTIAVPPPRTALNSADTTLFAAGRAALPRPATWQARYHIANGQFQINLVTDRELANLADVEFYPDTAPLIRHVAPQLVLKQGHTIWLETAADTKTPPALVRGVVVLVAADGQRQGYDVQLAPAGTDLAPAADAVPIGRMPGAAPVGLGFGLAFLFALGGGVLLNLMPCVFPILALKAFSLARSTAAPGTAQRDAAGYTAGVLATFLLIGASLLALRHGGAALGWGFQLQDPWLVAGLALLMVLVALNLFGLLEISGPALGQTLAAKSGVAGAFWTGALAVLVATPCTAPFMAGALGAALVLPPLAGMAIFAGLGVGMAAPFLLLGFVPAARRLLPRPGAWMESFKHFLGFPMLATALWLAWIVGQLTNTTTMALTLAAGLGLALAAWIWQRGTVVARGLAVAAAMAGLALPVTALRQPPAKPAQASDLADRTAYSDTKLASLRASGTPVFAYFTADWCISCKVNERVALDRESVTAAFKQRGVQVLVGDWTRRDPALTAVLARYGRAGVPLYLYFQPGAAQPVILPQVLTPDILIDAIRA